MTSKMEKVPHNKKKLRDASFLIQMRAFRDWFSSPYYEAPMLNDGDFKKNLAYANEYLKRINQEPIEGIHTETYGLFGDHYRVVGEGKLAPIIDLFFPGLVEILEGISSEARYGRAAVNEENQELHAILLSYGRAKAKDSVKYALGTWGFILFFFTLASLFKGLTHNPLNELAKNIGAPEILVALPSSMPAWDSTWWIIILMLMSLVIYLKGGVLISEKVGRRQAIIDAVLEYREKNTSTKA